MDVAYPARTKRREPDPLVYSLRSLWHHFPVERVFVAGGLPSGIDRKKVTYLPTSGGSKWEHIGANLLAVLESDISEDFLWMNDDFFILRDAESVPLMYRGPLAESKTVKHRRNAYGQGMRSQLEILRQWGYDSPLSFDAHVPMPINKTALKETLGRVQAEFPDHCIGHFRSVYGNLVDRDAAEIADPRLEADDPLDLCWTYVSTNESSWKGPAGQAIRDRYWRKSPWEVQE